MKRLTVALYLCLVWGWLIPAFFAGLSLFILIDEGIPDMLLGANRQFNFDFVSPVRNWSIATGIYLALSSGFLTCFAFKSPRP